MNLTKICVSQYLILLRLFSLFEIFAAKPTESICYSFLKLAKRFNIK